MHRSLPLTLEITLPSDGPPNTPFLRSVYLLSELTAPAPAALVSNYCSPEEKQRYLRIIQSTRLME